MKFHHKLQQLRKDRALSQEKLAELTGVSRQAVAKWETGETQPEIRHLVSLSESFRISIDKLVKDLDDENCAAHGADSRQAAGDLVSFLIRAKQTCYAGKGNETDPSRPASHDLKFQDGTLLYIDTYLGGEKFSGEEALWQNGQPIWAMNYTGRLCADGFDGDFLKECLYLVPPELPFRGPPLHTNGDFTYHCSVDGDFGWFAGSEEIFCRATKVYECRFHGGHVK